MRIVVLDGHALNPGDLSWDGFRALGEVTVHDRTPPGELPARAAGAEALLTNKTVLDRETLFRLPALRYVGVLATGHNVVDGAAARERGIPVTNVPAYSADSVAQLTFALLLELCQRVGHHAAEVRRGRWGREKDFSWWDGSLVELSGLTLGVVGYGNNGRRVAAIGRALGMRVLVHTPHPGPDPGEGIRFAGWEELLRGADVLSLHCPLTPATERMVDREALALMRPSAFLLNTSRGGLVDEEALATALREGRLAGAGLDVLAEEPPRGGSPLLAAPRCLITPHLGWATTAARGRLMEEARANLEAFLAGGERNVVNRGPAPAPR